MSWIFSAMPGGRGGEAFLDNGGALLVPGKHAAGPAAIAHLAHQAFADFDIDPAEEFFFRPVAGIVSEGCGRAVLSASKGAPMQEFHVRAGHADEFGPGLRRLFGPLIDAAGEAGC